MGCLCVVLTDWSDGCLYAHNEARSLHVGTSSMVYSQSLASQAAAYLNSVVSTGIVPHSCPTGQNCDYGENIYMMGSFDGTTVPDCAHAVYAWYRESVQYDYDYDVPFYEQPGTGHFTQVVWKDTTQVGCAVAPAPGPAYYILCQYQAPGNMQWLGDNMAELAISNVGPLDDASAPENPADLMETCSDMYEDICPFLASQCTVQWGVDFGPATLCPETCNKC